MPHDIDAADLNAAAARLMGWEYDEVTDPHGVTTRRYPSPTTDLRDAALLFRAAPDKVQRTVQEHLSGEPDDDWLLDTLDPAALTRAVVSAWQAHEEAQATPTPRPPAG